MALTGAFGFLVGLVGSVGIGFTLGQLSKVDPVTFQASIRGEP